MLAIFTHYIGASATKPARIKAVTENAQIVVKWDHSSDEAGNHANAAMALAKKMKWKFSYYGGSLEEGYVWVVEDKSSPYFTTDF